MVRELERAVHRSQVAAAAAGMLGVRSGQTLGEGDHLLISDETCSSPALIELPRLRSCKCYQ